MWSFATVSSLPTELVTMSIGGRSANQLWGGGTEVTHGTAGPCQIPGPKRDLPERRQVSHLCAEPPWQDGGAKGGGVRVGGRGWEKTGCGRGKEACHMPPQITTWGIELPGANRSEASEGYRKNSSRKRQNNSKCKNSFVTTTNFYLETTGRTIVLRNLI